MTQTELNTIRSAIEHSIIEATFVDSRTGSNKTEQFYGTTITAERLNSKKYKGFSFSLTAISKRTDM